jgi:hypothetical protein
MVHAVEKLYLMVEVAGCPTICRHCWAQGTSYQAMPVGGIAFVLEQAHRFCEEHGLGFGAYPMHEVAYLAAQYGDSHGRAVHFTAASVRYLWLDRAQRARRD